jgi:hypothetical protein
MATIIPSKKKKHDHVWKEFEFREHSHRDMFHADIMIQAIDYIHLPAKPVDPDIHCETFGILRSK